jgi:putative FmdB family regulatory protein
MKKKSPGGMHFGKKILYMPIFEYVCQNCGTEFEHLVFRTDEVVKCPECGQESVNKLMSACAAKVGQKFTSTSTSKRAVPAAAARPLPAAPAVRGRLPGLCASAPGAAPWPWPRPAGWRPDSGPPPRAATELVIIKTTGDKTQGCAPGPDRGQGPVHQGDRRGAAGRARLTWRCTASRICRRRCRRA